MECRTAKPNRKIRESISLSGKTVGPQKTAFLRSELESSDARRQKTVLQEISRLYRTGFQLAGSSRNGFEQSLTGLVVNSQDEKVIRWCLNALARFGTRSGSETSIEVALKRNEGNPEIVAAAVAAMSHLYNGHIGAVSCLNSIDPAIVTLAALQNTDPRKLDLSGFKIDIDRADYEVLKLALITVGLNKDVANLFDPRHSNGQIVKALGQHPDLIVKQYSVWAVIENSRLTISDLGIPLDDLEKHKPNVQAKLLHLAANYDADPKHRQDIIIRGSNLRDLEAREGLAKALTGKFYDGLQDVTLGWFDIEGSDRVKLPLVEHFARYSEQCGDYRIKALDLSESGAAYRDRVLLGAEGTSLFSEVKGSDVRDGTPDLFGFGESSLILELKGRGKKMELVKVLVLSANPANPGSDPLRLDREASTLKEQLRQVDVPKKTLQIENCWAVRPDQIQMELLNNNPSILHFSGHGDTNLLCFEDREGNPVLLDATMIAEIVQVYGQLECIVLNACFSESVARACAKHVKVVIGCDVEIDDNAAIAFTRGFYQSVAHGRDYENAFSAAKIEVRMIAPSEADKYVLIKA